MRKIESKDVSGMIDHWHETPVNGYLGSSYGQNAIDMLQKPLDGVAADNYIEKMKNDIYVLNVLPPDAINIYAVPNDVDQLSFKLSVAGKVYNLDD